MKIKLGFFNLYIIGIGSHDPRPYNTYFGDQQNFNSNDHLPHPRSSRQQLLLRNNKLSIPKFGLPLYNDQITNEGYVFDSGRFAFM